MSVWRSTIEIAMAGQKLSERRPYSKDGRPSAMSLGLPGARYRMLLAATKRTLSSVRERLDLRSRLPSCEISG